MRTRILRRSKKGPDARALRGAAAVILESLELGNTELSVLVTGDKEMWGLNLRYRGKDKPTDVLSFSQTEGEFGDIEPGVLGDVVISVDTAQRQADEKGHSLQREMDILLIHGILHLAGYDHEKGRSEAAKMKAKEKQLLAALEKKAV
ncbi:MAG: rRNA maturation RNase YbeY [Nitrospinae bacterium]|nr:rRNA maturation RNase YbeY [Nitrospinota bacterium]